MSSRSNGEQISIQLGEYANYVGTHFWNYQDELYMRCMDEEVEPLYKGHDVDLAQLFRVGRTRSGRDTCTPRLLAIDRKENMTACYPAAASIFRESGASDVLAAWAGPLTTITSEPIVKNSFQRLLESEEQQIGTEGADEFDGLKDGEVTQWSDFLKVYLHPRSVMPLPLKSGHTFDHFFAGRNAGTHLTREGSDELFDAVRLMLEDCDRVSCINMMVDIDDGFGGLGVQILEYLRDEVHGVMMPVWAFPEVQGNAGAKADGTPSKEQLLQRCGITNATAQMSDLASVLVPINAMSLAHIPRAPNCFSVFEQINIAQSQIYHTSAVAATVIETITGCQRIKLNSKKGQMESSMQENLWGPQEWVHHATRSNLLPVCNIDAAYGYPHSPEEVEALFSLPCPVTQYGGDLRIAPAHPFLSSLTSIQHGSWGLSSLMKLEVATGLPSTDDGRRSTNRDIFTNLLFTRGSSSLGVRETMLKQRGQYSCVINSFQHRNTPIPLPICFPDIFPRRVIDVSDRSLLSRYYYNGRLSSAELMMSMNTSPAVGRHLSLHAQTLRQTSKGIKAQLAQAGCDAEECEELEEKLMSLSERYNNN